MAHIHDLIDFTVDVFIVCDGKVLLRKHDKYKIWLAVGGHIELHEDPNQAAVRECMEEVGLDVTISGDAPQLNHGSYVQLIAPKYLNRHHVSPTHEHISLVYFATSRTQELKLSETEVSEECRWFTREELEARDDIKIDIKFYALKALEELR